MSGRSRMSAAALSGVSLAAAALLLLLVAVSVWAACGREPKKTVAGGRKSPSASPSASPSVSPSPTSGGGTASSKTPTVYLLDGSGARECIVSNDAWAAQIKKSGGAKVKARDLGSRNQTFLQDSKLVAAMPKGPSLVLIGLSVGRYTGEPDEGAAGYDAAGVLATTTEVKHQYSVDEILSVGSKEKLVGRWVDERYPVFQQTYAGNQKELEKLVKACKKRGFRPLLVELPLNRDIVGKSFDKPRATYRTGAKKLAAKYDVPYVDFVAEVKIPNGEFYDLMHLVEPGRVKWQKRLSEEVAALLERYGMGRD